MRGRPLRQLMVVALAGGAIVFGTGSAASAAGGCDTPQLITVPASHVVVFRGFLLRRDSWRHVSSHDREQRKNDRDSDA